ncbi:hypothetical protein NL676_017941 [Syzygium grande]|nr:hypothetical protein NL676_017941 [Syzygium grande]
MKATTFQALVKGSSKWESLCDRLKPVHFAERSYILHAGDLVHKRVFILEDKISSFVNKRYGLGGSCGNHLRDTQSGSRISLHSNNLWPP